MKAVLSAEFYDRDSHEVAKNLLGKYLVRKYGKKEISVIITEVEVYDGFKDKASHASKGRTKRNKIMFGEAGRWYVYLVYGMYWMLNVVTREKDYPAAILIRGAREVEGPGRLSKYLKIKRNLYGKKAEKKSGLWVEDRGLKIGNKNIRKTKRIGVSYAGTYWAGKKHRYVLNEI